MVDWYADNLTYITKASKHIYMYETTTAWCLLLLHSFYDYISSNCCGL